ncbi:MAG: transglutaminase-like domain-containing protein, partial [bacterium]
EWEGQRLLGASPLVVEVTAAAVPDKPLPLPIGAEPDFLKPSVAIQSDDPEVRAKSREATGDAREATAAARKLVSWAFTLIDKEATASYPTALDVLKHMKGDCNEHAVVVAALARAAGIPAKVAVGLVYLNGAFYYHAWNELYLGHWVPVDATFGEFPASAVHLKLAEGELSQQSEILGIVGRVKIKVLEFSLAQQGE